MQAHSLDNTFSLYFELGCLSFSVFFHVMNFNTEWVRKSGEFGIEKDDAVAE